MTVSDLNGEAIKDRLSRVEKATDALDKTVREQTATLILWTERASVLNERLTASDARSTEQSRAVQAAVDSLRISLSTQLAGIDARVQSNTMHTTTLTQDVDVLRTRVGNLEQSMKDSVRTSWFSGSLRVFLTALAIAGGLGAIAVELYTLHVIP